MGFIVADLIASEKLWTTDIAKNLKRPNISIMISWDTKDAIRPRQVVFMLIFTALAIGLAQVFRSWQRLRHIPGPFWASISDLPRLFWVKTKEAHLIHQQLHEKYGEVVRIGPNTVIFRDPAAISTVYPMRAGFPKGDFYAVLRPYQRNSSPLVAVFNSQDEALHKQIKNPIAPLYSLSNVSKLEGLIDDVLLMLQRQLDSRFASTGETFDLGDWCQYFAFEVMGTMTFSKGYGFIEEGRDMTQMYWLDRILYKNRIADSIRPAPGLGIMRASTAWTFSNVTAGSDSVGTVMRTCLYHLLANPRTLESLRSELQGADLTLPFPRLSEIRDLSYLDACVQEASRLHPPFALPFERVTPKEGVEVLGVPLPGGTVVGGSPYVVNRHKEWFGDDAEVWRPERWLVDEENRKRLERGVLTVAGYVLGRPWV
ncbi:hypothetical protein VSDG_07935 [Cytospora chrysosperma]|uniref:Cytochrome P450 n=1 Tax=Cytospora chrysosperma TaxID=252740 RepID=A0A423VKQ0_CYTCH|nr:hypothetical protein VSDG_07935 [Valsa sordida]